VAPEDGLDPLPELLQGRACQLFELLAVVHYITRQVDVVVHRAEQRDRRQPGQLRRDVRVELVSLRDVPDEWQLIGLADAG